MIASDLYPHRARLLRTLARRRNIEVIVADARALPFDRRFDRVLADVPCSGTGTLVHNPEIKWRLRPKDLLDLQVRQIAILTAALARVERGGRLVYSTCSMESEENEAVVEAALTSLPEFRVVEARGELEELRQRGELCWNDSESLVEGSFLRTRPGVHPCDGFFAAIIERKA